MEALRPISTITDIEGEEHNLYSYLDSGYAVIIDFSATWCGPCWNYHTSGVFEEIYEAHGPDGTNEVRILFIESDDSTTDDDLHGTGTSTWGDWTAGVEYPIADNGGNIFDLYQCAYYPTIFHGVPQPHHSADRPSFGRRTHQLLPIRLVRTGNYAQRREPPGIPRPQPHVPRNPDAAFCQGDEPGTPAPLTALTLTASTLSERNFSLTIGQRTSTPTR